MIEDRREHDRIDTFANPRESYRMPMIEDRRAHDRIDTIEEIVKKHIEGHTKFEAAIEHNTRLTQSIAENTAELVSLVRGAKGLRSFLVWAAPVVVALAGLLAWLKVAAK